MYCYLELNFTISTTTKINKIKQNKNKVKLFLIRVKELFEPLVVRKEKATGFFAIFKSFLEKPIITAIGDVTVKTQNWGGKSIFN